MRNFTIVFFYSFFNRADNIIDKFFCVCYLIELQRQKEKLDIAVLTRNNELKTLLNYKV